MHIYQTFRFLTPLFPNRHIHVNNRNLQLKKQFGNTGTQKSEIIGYDIVNFHVGNIN